MFLILVDNQSFTVKYDVRSRLFIDALYQVKEIPFYS